MAGKPNKVPMKQVAISIPQPDYEFLEELAKMGRIDGTPSGIARHFLMKQIEDFTNNQMTQKFISEMSAIKAYNAKLKKK